MQVLKLLTIGFDGLDPAYLSGLPTFSRFYQHLALLRSVPGTRTQEAWAALYTGKSPQELGVVALPRDPDRVSTLKGIRAQNMFEVMAQEGVTVGVIGMPMTFPVQPLRYFMVAGFPVTAPQYRADEEYFHPPDIKSIIEELCEPYLWADEEGPPPKEAVAAEAIHHSIEAEKRKVQCVHRILECLDYPSVEFLAIGFQFTDVAAHCRRVYPLEATHRAADDILAQIVSEFHFENLMVVSDHGLAMVPWRGDPCPGYRGVSHRLFGTLICVGDQIERALQSILRTRPAMTHERVWR